MYEQLDEFIERVQGAIEGKLDTQEQESLKKEIFAAYRKNPDTYGIAQATEKGFPETRAALRAYKDKMGHELAVANAQAGSISVSASANATTDVSIALSNAMRAVEDSKLTPEQVDELQQLMLETKRDARKGPTAFATKAAELLRKAGEYTAPLAEIIAIIQAAAPLIPPPA